MWHNSTLYFLSDRGSNERGNLWAYDRNKDAFRQVTNLNDYDIKYPSVGPSDIVFQSGSRMYRLDLTNEKVAEVPVQLVTDASTLKARPENVGSRISWSGISPTGQRAVFEARGEVFTVPAENGLVRSLTNTSGSAERTPSWSPDGKSIAYFSDKSGEYELTVRNADGTGEERTLSKLGPGFRYRPFWSPDSKQIAFIDQVQKIHVFNIATGKDQPIDAALTFTHGNLVGFTPAWSGDSRWLAYARDVDNGNQAIFVFDTRNNTRRQVTSGYFNDASPSFDPDGKYLYYLSGRTFAPTYSDLDNTWVYANSTNIVAVPLRLDVVSPLTPRNDEEPSAADATKPGSEKIDSTQKKAKETIAAASPAPKPSAKPVEIDFT